MNILIMLFMHYLLDYPLQGEFLAQTKGKYFYSLFAHSMIYGIGMGLTLSVMGIGKPILSTIILVITHMVIDYKKATAKDKDLALTLYLYLDQSLHILINLCLIYFLL